MVMRLCDVDARGRSVNVCDGIRRILLSQVAADARACGPWRWTCGRPATASTAATASGVQVVSAAFPRFARNPNTGKRPATATHLVPTDQEVFHDPSTQATSCCPPWQGHERSGRPIGRPRGSIAGGVSPVGHLGQWPRNLRVVVAAWSGSSIHTAWPAPATSSSSALGSCLTNRRAMSAPPKGSSSPHRKETGV
jgi:hypothetical protein